ncbi:hypothetical protein Poli38472_002524 [Pythium oligandrum]|uniref:Protein broad-minded n=1 Tax=Pythium oligandrum TaxID=41045 RepID=A0A8K1FME8_PYTOL|nr:hypothetical protein Poli38472_002524 [Pythium oligandrum]|eukprot:TMW63583.1 hypothetical protein Poli38472_002524 [Pythium oligandrum]
MRPLAGAMEALLLTHRAFIDDSLRPLHEDTSLQEMVDELQRRVLTMREQEPATWQLHVVAYIREFLHKRLAEALYEHEDETSTSVLQANVLEQLRAELEKDMGRITEMIGDMDGKDDEEESLQETDDATLPLFMRAFWKKAVRVVDDVTQATEALPFDTDNRLDDYASCEAIAFDDLQSNCGSANSAPSIDDIPSLLQKLRNVDSNEQGAVFQSLREIHVMEFIHCVGHFSSTVSEVLCLCVHQDTELASSAMALLYAILNNVEDGIQFSEIFVAVVKFVGTTFSQGRLSLDKRDASSQNKSHAKIVNVYRLLHLVLSRLPYHWIHLSPEKLTLLLYLAFNLLMLELPADDSKRVMSPSTVLSMLDERGEWFSKWTYKIPSRSQLFTTLEELNFVDSVMLKLSRFRPLDRAGDQHRHVHAIDASVFRNALSIMSNIAGFQHGRRMLTRWSYSRSLYLSKFQIDWIRCSGDSEFETRPTENDRLFRNVRNENGTNNDSDVDVEETEPLGDKILDALWMTNVVARLLDTKQIEDEDNRIEDILRDLSKYAPDAQELFMSSLEIVETCLTLTQYSGPHQHNECELEETDPWLPFRHVFLGSDEVQAKLGQIKAAASTNLELAIALHSRLEECPHALRSEVRALSILYGVSSTQYASALLVDPSVSGLSGFLVDVITRHISHKCNATPVTEDLCTAGMLLLSATIRCIPAMTKCYDTLLENQVISLLRADGDDSMSACSFLAGEIESSLRSVGGFGEGPLSHVLFEFEAKSNEAEMGHSSGAKPSFQLSESVRFTMNQILTVTNEAVTRQTPIDIVLLSQTTWELISDVEKTLNSSCSPLLDASTDLTKRMARIVHAIVMSGQSKLERGVQATAALNPSFPTDGERKLMNIYYKDYCQKLGLTASPTTFHLLVKTFGKSATDCFAVSILMLLGQEYSDQEIISFLRHCSQSPSCDHLWPALEPSKDKIPVTVYIAQAVELILEKELPQIFPLLAQCHCTVLMLVTRWLTQCYWNYFTWENIVLMVHLNFVYGTEFQVYLLVAVFKHIEPAIQRTVGRHNQDPMSALVALLQRPIQGFRFTPWRQLFLRLRSEYQDQVESILSRT